MTLRQMRYVAAIADTGSMNEAAATLYVSQPGISEAVRDLERETGMKLFCRTNRGVILTPEGAEFLSYARRIIDLYAEMEERFIKKMPRENERIEAYDSDAAERHL